MATKRNSRDERTRTGAMLQRLAPRRRSSRAGYAIAIIAPATITIALLPLRAHTTPLSKGFAFIIVPIAAATFGGLGPGIVASLAGFIAFNFFFIPPFGTLSVSRAEDLVVLFVFLGLSILISALLARVTERAEAAEAREAELAVLQELGTRLVSAVPGPETYEAALQRIVGLFGFTAASLMVQDDSDDHRGLREHVTVGARPGSLDAHWDPATSARAPERLPLSVGHRTLGLIVLEGERDPLSPAESRVLRAFCDQLALVLERDRLLRVAADAEIYRQTDHVRRSLLGAVSHELRSPLAAIKASVTDLLAKDAPTSADYWREVVEGVNGEADRLDALIANLLDMSRIEAGTLHARMQGTDLEETLRRCTDRTARMRALSFKLTVPADASIVRADPVFLERVITNLLENAAKASPDGAHVEIDAHRENGTTTVRIIDHGTGVPPTAREQIFYPFFGLDARNPSLGPGLGLAICKGFLNAMSGQIWIEDTPGGGATFAFSLASGSR